MAIILIASRTTNATETEEFDITELAKSIHNTKMTEDDKETAITGFINLPVMAAKEDEIEIELQLNGFSDALETKGDKNYGE